MANNSDEADKIEADIRDTRRSIDEKVEQLQGRLSPGDIVEGVVDFARTNGGAIADRVGRGVRDNPVPAAMIGAGVLWLAFSSVSRRRVESGTFESATDQVQRKASALRESVGERASAVAERAGEAGRDAAGQAKRAGQASERSIKDHPLLVGAAGIALGAAVAAALPRWQREDDVYGAQSDKMKQAAKEAALEEGRKVQHAARDAVEKAKQAAARATPGGDGHKRDDDSTAKAAGGSKQATTPGTTG